MKNPPREKTTHQPGAEEMPPFSAKKRRRSTCANLICFATLVCAPEWALGVGGPDGAAFRTGMGANPKAMRDYAESDPQRRVSLESLVVVTEQSPAPSTAAAQLLASTFIELEYLAIGLSHYVDHPAFGVAVWDRVAERYLTPSEFAVESDASNTGFELMSPLGDFHLAVWIDDDGDGIPHGPWDFNWWNRLQITSSSGSARLWMGRVVPLLTPVSSYQSYTSGSCSGGLTVQTPTANMTWLEYPEAYAVSRQVPWREWWPCPSGSRSYQEYAVSLNATAFALPLNSSSLTRLGLDVMGGLAAYGEETLFGLAYTYPNGFSFPGWSNQGALVRVSAGGTAPIAAFTWAPSAPATGQSVQFTDQSTASPTSWSWNFGDGGSSALQNPTHTYQGTGSFNVQLTATNSHGSNSLTRTVTVVGPGSASITVTGPDSGNALEYLEFRAIATGCSPSSDGWRWTSDGEDPEIVFGGEEFANCWPRVGQYRHAFPSSKKLRMLWCHDLSADCDHHRPRIPDLSDGIGRGHSNRSRHCGVHARVAGLGD